MIDNLPFLRFFLTFTLFYHHPPGRPAEPPGRLFPYDEKYPLNFSRQKSIPLGGEALFRPATFPYHHLARLPMASARVKSRTIFLGPLLLLVGLLWAGAAEQGILSFRHALPYGLAVAASGLIIRGLHGLRAGRWRLFSLAILLAGSAFFAVQLNYLRVDYKLAGTDPLRALLPEHQDQLLLRIIIVSALLLTSCLLGLLTGKFRSRSGSGPKKTKTAAPTRTAPLKSSRVVRSLRR
jgi:hypothetical protein